jgi:hypothetical protein
VKKNTWGVITAPFLLTIVVGVVKTKIKGDHHPPLFMLQPMLQKKHEGPLHLPLLFVIIICCKKNIRKAQCYICMLPTKGNTMLHLHAITVNQKLKGNTMPPTSFLLLGLQ